MVARTGLPLRAVITAGHARVNLRPAARGCTRLGICKQGKGKCWEQKGRARLQVHGEESERQC